VPMYLFGTPYLSKVWLACPEALGPGLSPGSFFTLDKRPRILRS
jgi:hypothetical protein